MSGISLCAMPVQAQFNTIATVSNRYKVEVLRKGMDKAEPTSVGAVPAQGASADIPASAPPVVESHKEKSHKEIWVGRYLSVSYPLQRIKINSSYGYRKDPFTGKRKFHNGIDLHARGDEVLAMMEGEVVKVVSNLTTVGGNLVVFLITTKRVLLLKVTDITSPFVVFEVVVTRRRDV